MVLSALQMTNQLQAQEETINSLKSQLSAQQENIANLGATVAAAQNSTTAGQIDNLLRNSKLTHSWDTWTNAAPVAGDQQCECAHVYTHEPDTAVESAGAMSAASAVLTISGNLFVSGDAGSEIVVEGAGASGENLVTTILTFTNDHTVTLSTNALTAVTGARVRWRLKALALTSTKTGTANVNAALKSSDHSHFSSNITDLDWNKPNGYAEFGGLNSIDFPLGYWNNTTNAFVFQNLVEPGKTYYAICKIARKNSTIKPKGFLKISLWDGSPGKRQIIEGGTFRLSARTEGVPAATVSSKYKIIAKTDQGETFESNVLTVNRPSDSSFVTGVIYEVLSWDQLAPYGIKNYEVWRETAGVFLRLTTITNANNIYADNNGYEIAAGAFPEADFDRKTSAGYSLPGDLESLVVDGSGSGWDFVRIPIAVADNYDRRYTSEQWFRAQLTTECDRQMIDGSTSGTDTLTSATANFTSADVGLPVTVVSGSSSFTGTIINVASSTSVKLSGAIGFSSSAAVITITGGGKNGLLIGEFGLSLTPAAWASNHDDNQTARAGASNPNGSTSGGNNPGGEPGGGGGPVIICFREDMRVRIYDDVGKITQIPIRSIAVGNLVASGNLKPNCVLKKQFGSSDVLIEIRAAGRSVFATPQHPFFRDFRDFSRKTPIHAFEVGDTIAMNIDGRDELHTIDHKEIHFGRYPVENLLEISPTHVFICEDFYTDNRKRDPDDPVSY